MRDLLKFYRLSDAIFYDHINIIYINLLNLSWIKMFIFEEYGAFNFNIILIKALSVLNNTFSAFSWTAAWLQVLPNAVIFAFDWSRNIRPSIQYTCEMIWVETVRCK